MLDGKIVLIVDGDRSFGTDLVELLRAERVDAISAFTAEDAMERLNTVAPDLIFLDMHVPAMGGLRFLKTIRGADGQYRFPVLVAIHRTAVRQILSELPLAAIMIKPASAFAAFQQVFDILVAKDLEYEPPTASCKRVLIAQKEREIASEWFRAFKEDGYMTSIVEDALGVLTQVPVFKPHAIVLNEILPDMNGGELAVFLRKMPTARDAIIVLCDWTHTASDDEQRIFHVHAGVDRLLTTGTAPSVLRAVNDLLAPRMIG